MHRADGDNEERQQRHQRSETTEEHRPTNLRESLHDSNTPLAMYPHPSSEIGKQMYIVRYSHRKRQDRRNHQHRRIDIHLGISSDTVGDEQATDNRQQRSHNTPPRACHDEHHNNTNQDCDSHQAPHLLTYVIRLAVCHVWHTGTARIERCIFRFLNDMLHLFSRDDVGRHRALLLPHAVLGECAQLNHNPRQVTLLRNELTCHVRLAVGAGTYAVHRRRTVGGNLIGDNLFYCHTIIGAHHKLNIRQRRHLVGIRQAVQQLIRQRAQRSQVFFGKVIVALCQHAYIIVVAEVSLELLGLHQHGVILNEIVVERGLLHHTAHTYNGQHNHHDKRRQHPPSRS